MKYSILKYLLSLIIFLLPNFAMASEIESKCPKGMIMWKKPGEGSRECVCSFGRKVPTDISLQAAKIGGCAESQKLSTPADIITSPAGAMSLWLDGDDPFGNGNHPNDNSAILKWIDKSGNANHAIQENAENAPNFVKNFLGLNEQNGKDAYVRTEIQFDGQNDSLNIGAGNVFNPSDASYSLFAVLRSSNINTNGGFLRLNAPGSAIVKSLMVQASGAFRESWPNINLTSSPSLIESNQYYMVSLDYQTGRGGILRINGAEIDADADARLVTAQEEIQIGRGSAFWNGAVGEIIIYKTSLTSPQIMAIEDYLQKKWGI